jgi:hypothetical protein
MGRSFVGIFALVLAASTTGIARDTKTVTWTGWFSDKGCATPRVAAGNISPNGTECVKKCLRDGATPVFISEQAKALFVVVDYPNAIDDVGYRLEITGAVNEDAKTLSVKSVKHLSEVVNVCALPKKVKK